MTTRKTALKRRLDTLYSTYGKDFVSTDPLLFPTRYKEDGDREVVGLIAASLAYGRVAQIKKSVEAVLGVMGDAPRDFVMSFDPEKSLHLFSSFKHRFNTGRDVACLIYFMRQMIERSGSIGGFFTEGRTRGNNKGKDKADNTTDDKTIKAGLTSFTERALALSTGGVYGKTGEKAGEKAGGKSALPKNAGVRYFFPSPKAGSACKRLNLYLRWMVRSSGVDLGIWKGVSPSALIIPIDTHLARISKLLGLTSRSSSDWRMAEEVTGALRELDPTDPVKYDFALCRLGILDECPSRVDPVKCDKCLIKELCIL